MYDNWRLLTQHHYVINHIELLASEDRGWLTR
jgi:hypothetical protein